MSNNVFFENKGPFSIKDLFPAKNIEKNTKILDVKTLDKSKESEITFFDSIRYKNNAILTKAPFCLTTKKLSSYLPKSCTPIIVDNVLYELARITKKFYPLSDIDYPDLNLAPPNFSNFTNVKFGNNVLIGKNVKIGNNSFVGSNTVLEHDVVLGDNCVIGSEIIIKNTIVGDNVVIQDGTKIGNKGFGFIPLNKKNLKFPHIGKVIINDNVEIASGCTIDRGSIDDTEIGSNTYLDNQVHIAHNVKIGKNCMIAGQVGFAGSSILGDNVQIGGQAGISGHLKIGNNVKIGGGSGVVKDIKDNTVVMGYPALPLKEFLKK
ncbi:MAG: UDP-3-O-(3-hydroxymyristoyl)glucosamine N-acyltransferase [Pelagibacteraceae bacterium]